jgi:hypothetical protein
MAARAITAGELTKLRRDNQSTRLYVAFLSPATVYTAQVNQTFTTTDEITQITYDTGSGVLADIKIGMTLWVGSSAGAYDLGFCRIRATPGAATFYISEESKIDWAEDLYLTVVREFLLLPKHIKLDDDGNVFMDVDVTYSDQHATPNPVPLLGPYVRVLKLAPTTASIAFSASNSYVIGSTISTYSWTCATCSASSGTGTATPTFTFNAVGWHLIECTITAVAGSKTKTGYRWVYVYDDANKPAEAQLEDCAGDAESGGWSFSVTLYDQADLTAVRDRALAVCFAEDVYGTEAGSIGPVSGAESTIAWGWIAGETALFPPTGRGSEVSFTAQGPQAWLTRIPAFPVGVEDSQAAPTVWTEFEDLTVRKGAWHMLEWRTTATTIIDVNLTSDTRGLPSFEGGRSNLWDQLTQNCFMTILAPPRVDRYGSLYIDVDANYTPEANRGSFPTVMTLTRPDWSGQIQVERRTVPWIGQVNLSGIAYVDGEATSLFSLAPGHIPNTHGGWDVRDRLLLSSQALSNELAGLVIARENNEFPGLTISLAANNRFFDIAPAQYLVHTAAASDTARGFSYANKKFIPRRVRFVHDRGTLSLTCEIEVEAEIVADLGITGDAPAVPPDLPLPPIEPLPPIITLPKPPAEATEVWFLTTNATGIPQKLVWSGDFFQGGQPDWNAATLPSLGSLASTSYGFDMTLDGSAAYLYAVTSDSHWAIWKTTNPRVASPTWSIILESSVSTISGSLIDRIGEPFVYGSRLICITRNALGNEYYSEYNGVSWTNSITTATAADPRNMTIFYRAYGILFSGTHTVRSSPGNGTLDSFTAAVEVRDSWQNLLGGSRYMFRQAAGPTYYVRNVSTATDVLTGFAGFSAALVFDTRIRGAHRGTQVIFIDDDGAGNGQIQKSADGSSWSTGATWLPGIVETALMAGGNTMVWMPHTTTNSNVIARISSDGFATAGTDMTGDFWTNIQPAGDFYMANMRVIFKRNTSSGQ